ncbi:hypothetical protein LX97_00107 [Nonlabens dokdonensis]|uniref:Transmembrane protein n=2 Tax=Nonlabens dokdonensis TaxID=328515 RepID=L7W5N9_NONDD|nr:hypothetical protein [Nonlabens dokdonensis]AGC75409.1 hypothetical protein DDD_0282 [Nonlabens dokdonensis DSW-6]PZX43108.1 hypothetical protein LX97_00107 [Nonlabens dokdonensis]
MKSSALKKFCEFERKGGVFPLLPVSFKWIGIGIAVLAILGLMLTAYKGGDDIVFFKDLLMHMILIGLFILVLSRDKNEDERTNQLRYRAFAFAFVLGSAMLLLLPFIVIFRDGLRGKSLEWEFQSFFFIMSSYLFYYLMYFKIFKRQL